LLSSEISDFKNLAKVSIVGHPAVGKTSMLKLLSENIIVKRYIPTQGFDLKTVKFNDMIFKIWDFGGQKSYLTYLDDYLIGSDIVIVVTDSSARNVLNTKSLIERIKDIVDKECPIIVIANKQDLCESDGRMNQRLVEDILHVKTIGLTAINPLERTKLLEIINKELNQVLFRKEVKKNEF
jgi:small GTP-binding protein